MAKIVRYDGNLKAFASEQQTNERTLFGQATIANDLTSQITAQFLRGWGIVSPSDQPSLQDFNAAMYTNGQLLAYLHQMGVAEYNAAQEYFIGSLAQTGGVLYMSITDANTGNTPSSSPASWKAFTADQATEAVLGLVKIATQAQTNAGTDDAVAVTPKKLSATTQGQKHTAFTSTGTSTAQALTPAPAITNYAANQRFNVTFNIASGLNPTINVSGLGSKNLKQYDSSGAKVGAVFYSGMNSDIIYDGTDWILKDPAPAVNALPQTGLVGGSRNLLISAPAASASATITADSVVVEAGSLGATQYRLSSFSKSINLAATGVGGMDTGAAPVNGFVAIYAIYNPAAALSGTNPALLAQNATAAAAPNIYAGVNMPAGYTASALLTVLATNGSGQIKPCYVRDRKVFIAATTGLTGGTAASYSPALITGVVPLNAITIGGHFSPAGTSGSTCWIAGSATGIGEKSCGGNTQVARPPASAFSDLPLITPQTFYYYQLSSSGVSVTISEYEI